MTLLAKVYTNRECRMLQKKRIAVPNFLKQDYNFVGETIVGETIVGETTDTKVLLAEEANLKNEISDIVETYVGLSNGKSISFILFKLL